MTTTHHTPGPWKIGINRRDQENYQIYSPTHEIATVDFGYTEKHGNGKASARLIASAPQLLEATKVALKELEEWYKTHVVNGKGTEPYTKSAIRQLKQVITQAEGRDT